MSKYIFKYTLIGMISFCILFFSCEKETNSTSSISPSKALFSLTNKKTTGLDFENTITQTAQFNILSYDYFLNGGGVAVGDFNNDNLPDLYFTGNQVDDKIYINKGDLKFEDITKNAGINIDKTETKSWSTGVTTVDINNDGFLDIYVCKSGLIRGKKEKENLLYINNGDSTFTEQGGEYGINDPGFSTQATFFDYDKDGDLDLYVLNHTYIFGTSLSNYIQKSQDANFVADVTSNLYKNVNGKFIKTTKEAGLARNAFGLGVVASDYDLDSWVDLYATSDYDSPDYLFKNKKGKFKDVINSATKHISFYGMGCDIADINNDGYPEISVVDMTPPDQLRSKVNMASMDIDRFHRMHNTYGFQYQYMINTLQLNQGNGFFSEIAQLAGVSKTDWSWSNLMADFDNDGKKDLFITNGLLNDAKDNDFINAFKKRQREQGKNFTDKERVKWLNKLPSQKLKNYIFKNEGHLKFKEANKEWGLNELTFSNGAAYADFDLDGDLDIIINNINDPVYLYENHQSKRGNNYLQIQLKGIGKNPMGLNAKVKVYTDGELQYQELTLTRGFQSACDNVLHFGLGEKSKVDSVVVVWLDNFQQKVNNVEGNQKIIIDRAEAKDKYWYPKKETLYFANVGKELGLNHRHVENDYDDFKKELLLPHKNSQHGPTISVADVNGDQLEDFFIGGAANQAGALYLQKSDGTFSPSPNQPCKQHYVAEDMGSLFFDYDNDGDQDLYVVGGGNEFEPGAMMLQDRLYVNDGKGNFSYPLDGLPHMRSSGSKVVTADFDQDGKTDLFVGGRMKPGHYPYPSKSYILIQRDGKYLDVTSVYLPELENIGLVTDAAIEDIDGDGKQDLLLVGEWMSIRVFRNTGRSFVEITPENISSEKGWWNTIEKGDFDNDGDQDFIVGNLGLNYKYKAKKEQPFQVHCDDFDKSGNLDIVLSYHNDEGVALPVRGRECSSQQMPFIEDKFPTYKSFASANLIDVLGKSITNSYNLKATNFSTSVLLNEGGGQFKLMPLPTEAQVSCTNAVVVNDFNNDKNLDLLIGGNLYVSEVETPRNDAGVGLLLFGNGDGSFKPVSAMKSGFFSNHDTKDLKLINNKKYGPSILVANNNGPLQIFSQKK